MTMTFKAAKRTYLAELEVYNAEMLRLEAIIEVRPAPWSRRHLCGGGTVPCGRR